LRPKGISDQKKVNRTSQGKGLVKKGQLPGQIRKIAHPNNVSGENHVNPKLLWGRNFAASCGTYDKVFPDRANQIKSCFQQRRPTIGDLRRLGQ